MTEVDIHNIPDNWGYGPIQSAPLPYFLEMLTKIFNESNFSFGTDKRDPIDRFTFDPPIQALLEKTNYTNAEKSPTAATTFEAALSFAQLTADQTRICRIAYDSKQAGKAPAVTAAILSMKPSTLRAHIAAICRDHPTLRPFIQNCRGRPRKPK